MKNFIFLALLLTVNNLVYSNDSRMFGGGSLEIIDNENTNVIMKEEEIKITLYGDYYEVDVTFDFFNEGPAENILVGFPIKADVQDFPSAREDAHPQELKMYINGNLLTEYNIKEEEHESSYSYVSSTTWYIKEVTFPEQSHTYSRVTYRMLYSYSGFFSWAEYIYGTGHNWKGPIGKMTVIINHEDDLIIDSISFGGKKPNCTIEGNGKYKYELENIEPYITDEIYIYRSGFNLYAKYNPFSIESKEYGGESEGWVWDERLLYKDFNEIKFLTLNQIRLFINYFYAMHGYDFNDPLYKSIFENLTSFRNYKSSNNKYIVNPYFSENDFNDIERKNIEYLQNLEKMILSKEGELPEGLYDAVKDHNIKIDSLDKGDSSINKKNTSYIWKYIIISIVATTAAMALTFIIVKRKNEKSTINADL